MKKKDIFDGLLCPNETDKILLLTHTDLDAAGAVIALKNAFNKVD